MPSSLSNSRGFPRNALWEGCRSKRRQRECETLLFGKVFGFGIKLRPFFLPLSGNLSFPLEHCRLFPRNSSPFNGLYPGLFAFSFNRPGSFSFSLSAPLFLVLRETPSPPLTSLPSLSLFLRLSSVSSTPFFSVLPTVSPARATFCRMACLTAGHGRSLSRLLKSPPREPPWLLRFSLGRFQWRSPATFSIIGRESYRLALLLPTLFDRPLSATCLCRKRLCRAMAGRWIGKYRSFTIFIAIRIIINIDRLGSVWMR